MNLTLEIRIICKSKEEAICSSIIRESICKCIGDKRVEAARNMFENPLY